MHASELAAQALNAAALVVYSGDGGFNEALNGLTRPLPVGFLPGGRTNVLPRALGLARDPVEAAGRVAEALRRGRTRAITLGRVNGRRFGFSAGIGFDAELVRRVDALGRRRDGRRPGDAAYVVSAAALVAARRGTFGPSPEIAGLGRARLLRYALSGRGQTEAEDIRYGHDLDRIEIVCDGPLPLQADGEDLGDIERAVFEAERNAVHVLV